MKKPVVILIVVAVVVLAGVFVFQALLTTQPQPIVQTNQPTDTDSDGLPDLFEQQLGSNPAVADSDGDGIVDSKDPDVLAQPTTQTPVDTDGDGLPDDFERQLGSNPAVADSDGDGVADGQDQDSFRNAE